MRSPRSSRYPERPVIALVGDGAMQMNNMAELITVSKYWQGWSDPRWICMVLNNQDLNQVTWEQRAMEGDPKFEASQDIPSVPYHKFAELIGLKGIYVDDAEQMGAAWDEALAANRPVVIEVKADPNIAAAAAAYHARAGQSVRVDADEGRPERRQRHRRDGEAGARARYCRDTRIARERYARRDPTRSARRTQFERSAYTIPTDRPEADGTFAWESTTLVRRRGRAGRQDGHRLHL